MAAWITIGIVFVIRLLAGPLPIANASRIARFCDDLAVFGGIIVANSPARILVRANSIPPYNCRLSLTQNCQPQE